jgi:hypothetical protein
MQMLSAKLKLNECLKLIEDVQRETHSPEVVAHKIKMLKVDILTLMRIADDQAETVVEHPQAGRAQ